MTSQQINDSVKASSVGFGNFIDPTRSLVDFPHLSLVEVDLPEYARNGLGKALLKVVRYSFVDLAKFGVEGLSVGADSSRGHVVYGDLNPVLAGLSHTEVQDKADPALLKALYQRKLPLDLITLGVMRASQFNHDVDQLCEFLDTYHRRSSWMESHPVEVRFSNIEALTGNEAPFDWSKLFSTSGV